MGRWDNDEEKLVGAEVQRVEGDEDVVRIHTDRGTLTIEAYGDCCSHSYFLNPKDMQELVGQVVTAVDLRAEPRHESIEDESYSGSLSRFYGAEFAYKGGTVFLEMRNDSNGYYGGSFDCSWSAGLN